MVARHHDHGPEIHVKYFPPSHLWVMLFRWNAFWFCVSCRSLMILSESLSVRGKAHTPKKARSVQSLGVYPHPALCHCPCVSEHCRVLCLPSLVDEQSGADTIPACLYCLCFMSSIAKSWSGFCESSEPFTPGTGWTCGNRSSPCHPVKTRTLGLAITQQDWIPEKGWEGRKCKGRDGRAVPVSKGTLGWQPQASWLGQPYHKGRWRRKIPADSGVCAFGNMTLTKLNFSVLSLVSWC